MLRVKSAACAALVLALVVPATVSAQYGDTGESKKPTINIFGTAGSASVMRDLDANETARLKSSYTVGGGVGTQINPNLGLRLTVDYSPAEAEGITAIIDGKNMDRMFYGVDGHFRAPLENGLAPYLALGLGGVTVSNADDADFDTYNGIAGKGAFGVEYLPKSSPLSYYAQGTTYLYKYKADVYYRWQSDLFFQLGLKYRLTR